MSWALVIANKAEHGDWGRWFCTGGWEDSTMTVGFLYCFAPGLSPIQEIA